MAPAPSQIPSARLTWSALSCLDLTWAPQRKLLLQGCVLEDILSEPCDLSLRLNPQVLARWEEQTRGVFLPWLLLSSHINNPKAGNR